MAQEEVTLSPPGEAFQDIVQADTVAADTLDLSGVTLVKGITLTRPPELPTGRAPEPSTAMSWVLASLFAVFIVACLRYRSNSRFFTLMLHEATGVRERHNAFDDTFRETTFTWLLNLLWCGGAGILLYRFLFPGTPGEAAMGGEALGRLGVCIGMAAAFTLFLAAAYTVVGNVFADTGKASLWLKGYLSLQGLEAILMFPLALLALCVPSLSAAMVAAGAVIFILAKIIFIYKGFCIFFTRIASWVLFLYYLCSLEIVPIVLTYVSARYLCGLL